MAIPHLVAHRGHMEIYPENTLVGLEAALQCGASYIEFDVQCAADGTLIVLHDTELLRTCGVNGNIFEMSWDELQNIRGHEPARFSLAFFNQRIPSLADAVRLLQRYPRATAFVEIKEESIDRFGINQVMPALLSELEIIHSQCVVISFHPGAIKYVRDHSDFLCGWVLPDHRRDRGRVDVGLRGGGLRPVGIAVGGMAPNLFGSTMFVGLLEMIAWILVSDRHRR